MVLLRLALGLEAPDAGRKSPPLGVLPPEGSLSSSEQGADQAAVCGMIVLAVVGERLGALDAMLCEKEDGLGK